MVTNDWAYDVGFVLANVVIFFNCSLMRVDIFFIEEKR
jgi:hypothetical protein